MRSTNCPIPISLTNQNEGDALNLWELESLAKCNLQARISEATDRWSLPIMDSDLWTTAKTKILRTTMMTAVTTQKQTRDSADCLSKMSHEWNVNE